MEPEKHGCVWHIHGAVRADHVVSTLWSTSELTVADCVGDRLGKLYLRVRNRHGYKRGMADASTSQVRETSSCLRQTCRVEEPSRLTVFCTPEEL